MKRYIKPSIIEEKVEFEDIILASTGDVVDINDIDKVVDGSDESNWM